MTSARKDGLGILGIGAAACVACCVGPILAFLGGLSLAGIVSALFLGGAGVVVAAIAAAGLFVARRRRVRCSDAADRAEPVAVGPPTTKLPVR
jgi:hypothetical protein